MTHSESSNKNDNIKDSLEVGLHDIKVFLICLGLLLGIVIFLLKCLNQMNL